jgi:hypothetical protein
MMNPSLSHPIRPLLASVLTCLLLSAGAARNADDEKPKPEAREAVATVASPAGTILAGGKKNAGWKVVKAKGELFSTDPILALPGFHGVIEPNGGSVQLTLLGNLPAWSVMPVFESAVVQHKDGEGLDFSLVRGRVLLSMKEKGKGPASARVRVTDKVAYDIRLNDSDSQVAVEMYRRWPNGTVFSTVPNRRGPHDVLVISAVKGKAYLKSGGEEHLMQSPSLFQWDNLTGPDARPSKLDKVPGWVGGLPATAEAKAMEAAVKRLQKRLQDDGVEKALADSLASTNKDDRELAVYAYAATGDVAHLAEALSDVKRADVRAAALNALRQWIGQAADHDLQLYTFLRKEWNYTTEQAEIVVQLLHGFKESDRDRAETYETLIEYLRHRKRSVRELARYHLYRWVIDGRKIPYDASFSTEQLDKAVQAWKELIPSGKLPPAPKEK